MGDHQQMGKPCRYVTSHPGQHSLASCHSIVGRYSNWCPAER